MINIYFFVLLLGHLLADFVFQPKKLVEWKFRSKIGVLVHVLIHLGFYLLLIWQFCLNVNIGIVVLLLAASHFIIDLVKIYFERKHKFSYLKTFLADQFAHVICVIFAGVAINIQNPVIGPPLRCAEPLINLDSPIYFLFVLAGIVFVLAGFVYEITKFQIMRERGKITEYKPNWDKIFIRGFVITLLFLVVMLNVVLR